MKRFLLSIILILTISLSGCSQTTQKDGFDKSIEQNQKRFGMSDQLTQIFINTTKALGW